MVIVRIEGGLGNQFFQYALGRRVALTMGSELLMDLTYFARRQSRPFWLDKFQTVAKPADTRLAWKLCNRRRPGLSGAFSGGSRRTLQSRNGLSCERSI